MNQPVQEIVVYRLTGSEGFDPIRSVAEDEVSKLPGWLGWSHFVAEGNPLQRVDLVTWQDELAATGAGREVGGAERFASFRDAIAEVTSFGHYRVSSATALGLLPGLGLELGRFRLRSGESEAAMRAAHRAMVDGYLSKQEGWVAQSLVALGNGAFVDLAIASSERRSRAICARWAGNPLCEAFLAYVEDPDMAFGTFG
jgi:hypothetical protein